MSATFNSWSRIESLESRNLLSAYLSVSPATTLSSLEDVGFHRNPIAHVRLTVNSHSVSDPEEVTVQVDYGDGSGWETPEVAPIASPGGGTYFLVKGSHTYNDTGLYTIRVKANGPEGTFSDTTIKCDVSEIEDPGARPIGVAGNSVGARPLGETSLFISHATTMDIDEDVSLDQVVVAHLRGNYNFSAVKNASDFKAQVNWGDSGAWLDGEVIADSSDPTHFKILGTHTYIDPGVHYVTVRVSGPDGQTAEEQTTSVMIRQAEPVPTPSKPFQLHVDQNVVGDQINTSWGPVKGATGYQLEINDGPDFPTHDDADWQPLKPLGPAKLDTSVPLPKTGPFYLRVKADVAQTKDTPDPVTQPIKVDVQCDESQHLEGDLSTEQLRAIVPNLSAKQARRLAASLNRYMPQYANVNTPARWAAFLAQASQETVGMRYMEEGGWITNPRRHLRAMTALYGPKGQYGYQPDIVVPGVGPQGPHYWGRGLVMLTHKGNYQAFNNWLHDRGLLRDVVPARDTLVKNPDLVATNPDLSALSAAWYWSTHNRRGNSNALADSLSLRSFQNITRNINGGQVGEAVREQYYRRAVEAIYFGAQPGETVTNVGGQPIRNLNELLTAARNHHPEETVNVTVTQNVNVNGKRRVRSFQRLVRVGC